MEGEVESSKVDVLDGSRTGVGPGVGGEAVFWCEGDTG